MPAISIVSDYRAVQYIGSNSAEIDSLITGLAIISESGGVLNVESPVGSSTYAINTSDWVIYTQGQISSVLTSTAFDLYYVRNALYGEVSDLDTRVDALEAVSGGIQAAGVAEAPTLLFGQSTNVDVDIIPVMSSSSYTPYVQLFAPSSVLGVLSVAATTVLDSNTVRVTIQNSGLVSLSGVRILVVATT